MYLIFRQFLRENKITQMTDLNKFTEMFQNKLPANHQTMTKSMSISVLSPWPSDDDHTHKHKHTHSCHYLLYL